MNIYIETVSMMNWLHTKTSVAIQSSRMGTRKLIGKYTVHVLAVLQEGIKVYS